MRRKTRNSRGRALLGAGAITILLVLAGGSEASAHAALVSSEPEPGAGVSSAPGVVVLRFSEPLIERLSRAMVLDPDGDTHAGRVSGEREVRVPLATNAPGVYEVEWTTVSPVDGHTLQGSFRFGVGVSPGTGAEGETGTDPQRADLLIAVARSVEYAALLLALGMLVLRRMARREPAISWVRLRLVPVLAVALVSGAVVVLGEAVLAAGSLSPGRMAAYFTSGVPGIARLVRVGAEALALLAALRGRSPALYLAVTVVALASAGHAAAVSPRWWGVGVDAAHLLAAGIWAGGIIALATMRPPGGWQGQQGRGLLDRFSAVALTAFVLTVGFGVLRGVQELAGFSDLFDTSYGRVLGIKVLGVTAMVPLSVLVWLRIRGTPRVEAAVAVGVVAMAALLAAYPLPPARLDEAEAGEEPSRQASALPREGDLTMGGEAGEVLLGLTIRPAEPGSNEVLVYVLPLEGEEAARGVAVTLSTGDRRREATDCGPTCRRAELDLVGGEELAVTAGGGAGGTHVFRIPALPAAGGSALFARMQERMHELRTYRLEEVLSSGRATVRADYAFQAPDRMRIEVDSGSQRVIVGNREWSRDRPGEPWQQDSAIPPQVPRFIWDFGRDPVAPNVLGRRRVAGAPATVLSFFGGSGGTPIWFRLWVDDQGLVRRAEMRAQGHFMDHSYFAYDSTFRVVPPIGPAKGREG
ncbi:MAG: copper resistance CopC/CopD family protein [Actinomycetota bacterium]